MFGFCFRSELECFIESIFEGDGEGIVIGIGVLFVFYVVIFLAVALMKAIFGSKPAPTVTYIPPPAADTPAMQILKERFASGEISTNEYRRLAAELRS